MIGSLQIKRSFGAFVDAHALSIDGFGDLYICDAGAPGIYKYSADGDSLRAAVGIGSEHGWFDRPTDVDASLTNSIAVSDRDNDRIELYSRDLIWQATIEGGNAGSAISFMHPEAVCAGSSGDLYIIEGSRHRLLAINPNNGTQQSVAPTGLAAADFHPVSIAIDGGEYIAAADANSGKLMVFNNTFTQIASIPYPDAATTSLSASGETVLALSENTATVRLFGFRNLSYMGSYKIPKRITDAVAVCFRNGTYYILTKEKVFECSINRP